MTISKEQAPFGWNSAVADASKAVAPYNMPISSRLVCDMHKYIEQQAARIAEMESQAPSALREKLRSAEARIAELEQTLSDRLEGSFIAPPGYVMVPQSAGAQGDIAHVFPDDLLRLKTTECAVTVYSVPMSDPDRGHTAPLYEHLPPPQMCNNGQNCEHCEPENGCKPVQGEPVAAKAWNLLSRAATALDNVIEFPDSQDSMQSALASAEDMVAEVSAFLHVHPAPAQQPAADERKAFEAWIASHRPYESLRRKFPTDPYAPGVQCYWEAWQARADFEDNAND